MKTIPILLLLANSLLAQTETTVPQQEPEKTFEMFDIQQPPAFPGGEKALLNYLEQNIQYPVLAVENNIQGVVALTFVVGKDGSITDVLIVKDLGAGCGKEAARVVQNMPKWSPGIAHDQPVRVRFTLPIRFRLTDNDPAPAPTETLLSDQSTIWKNVHDLVEDIYHAKSPKHDFKITRDKKKLKMLVEVLENQFQVNIDKNTPDEIKTAGALSKQLFAAQHGIIMFSKPEFQGKAERMTGNRKDCANGNCPNLPGSIIVPKGLSVTFYAKSKFKGDKLIVDATENEVRVGNLSNLQIGGPVRTSNKTLNWQESVKSIQIDGAIQH